jgi:drug/metabolite transporter (DMT)-like permease
MLAPAPGAARSLAAARTIPLVLLLTVGTLLGLTATLVKLAVASGWPPLTFLFWSSAGAGAVLLVAAVQSGHRPRVNRRDVTYYFGAGLLSAALPNGLSFAAIPHVGAGFVALCLAFPPLLTYWLALVLSMERFNRIRALGVGLALLGALLIASAKAAVGRHELAFVGVALSAPLVIAAGNIYRTLNWPAGAHPMALAPGMLLAASLMLFIFMKFEGIAFVPAVSGDGLVLLATEIVVFSATYSLYFLLQKLAGPVYLSQIGSVAAVAGAALAILVLGETAAPVLGLAMITTLAGAYLVNRTR